MNSSIDAITLRILMSDFLSPDTLMAHVRALADSSSGGIERRPAGSAAGSRAREYIRRTLENCGISQIEAQAFQAPDSWSYGLILSSLVGLAGALIGKRKGAVLTLASA